jgi:hypothetical protein
VAFDDVAAKMDFACVLSEFAISTDRISCGINFSSIVLESVSISDETTRRLLWNEIDDSQIPNWQNVVNVNSSIWTQVDDTQNTNWQPVAA